MINNPLPGVEKALVIAGSDRRGTAYGLLELSRLAGVSPWIWWADVLPEPQKALFASTGQIISGPPSVKYRGIFLNDEDWGLQPWAARNIDTDIQDIGPKTYEKIFELMLRLRANYLWPAMHECTKAFYYYPENPVVADRYAIVMGASHCEPMQRNNVFEWNVNFENEYGEKPGDWRYDTNKEQINRYWDDRLKTSSQYETFYTIGMRGIHDSGMPGPKDQQGKIDLLEKVIDDQRDIFGHYYEDSSKVPQLFCPYKEVLHLYQQGLQLPDDITLVWADDNHGYIRQLSTPEEQQRNGGSGVYYHISYWGAPHDFLWLSSISLSLIAFEMTKAHQFGADRLWVLNVGDIKPAEMETHFFMDLAWNIDRWTPENAHGYARYWAEETFGKKLAKPIAAIKKEYYRLAQNGKPEHLRMLAFDPAVMQERLDDYEKLMDMVSSLEHKVPERLKDAWFQLIKYPVDGAALMNQKVFYAAMSLDAAEKGDSKALEYAGKATSAFETIKQLTHHYNTELTNGKWNGMMSCQPRSLPVYGMPPVATAEMLTNPALIVRDDISKNKYLDAIPGISASENPTVSEKLISLSAASFFKKNDNDEDRIALLEALGLGGRSICRLPFTGQSFTNEKIQLAPYVEYKVKLSQGEYEFSVKCLPTQRIHTGRKVAYAIEVNNSEPKVVDTDVSHTNRIWGPAVISGYSEGQSIHKIETNGTAIIRVYLLDTGLAINRIDIKPAD